MKKIIIPIIIFGMIAILTMVVVLNKGEPGFAIKNLPAGTIIAQSFPFEYKIRFETSQEASCYYKALPEANWVVCHETGNKTHSQGFMFTWPVNRTVGIRCEDNLGNIIERNTTLTIARG